MTLWADALTSWHDYLTGSVRATTRKLRLYHLRRLAELFPNPWTVTTDAMLSVLNSSGWSGETRRSYRSSWRQFYAWATRRGHIATDPAAELPAPSVDDPTPRPAPEDVVEHALVGSSQRVRLMVMLAAQQGMRRGEIARVHSDDLVRNIDRSWSLLVHGKGGKTRKIPLHPHIAAMLRQLPEGWAFPGRVNGHLSAPYVGKLVRRRLPGPWTTHTLRHRFATVTYGGTRDIEKVSRLLGHTRTETTRRYVAIPDDDLRDAIRWAA